MMSRYPGQIEAGATINAAPASTREAPIQGDQSLKSVVFE